MSMYEELLEFVSMDERACRILLLDGSMLLPELLKKMPNASIEVCGVPSGENPRVHWLADWREGALSFAPESFQYIIAPRIFEFWASPEDLVCGFYPWLRQDGCILTCFGNIRHWSVLAELMQGHFRYQPRGILAAETLHFFALPEIIHLFEYAHYRDLKFRPLVRAASLEIKDKLEMAGFVNGQDDLDTEYWCVKASRSTPAAGYLKSQFSAELRQELVYLLRRIENDIAVDVNTRELLQLCTAQGVSMDYLAKLAENTMVSAPKVLQSIVRSLEMQEGTGHGI